MKVAPVLSEVQVRECMLGTLMAKRTTSRLKAAYLFQGTAIALVALTLAGCANQPKKELTTGSISRTPKPVQSMRIVAPVSGSRSSTIRLPATEPPCSSG